MTTITTIQTKTKTKITCLTLTFLSILTLFVLAPTPTAIAKTTAIQNCYAPTGANDTLSFSEPKFKTNWTGDYQCSFNKFNPSLGILKKVNMILTGSVLASVSVENEDVGNYSNLNISNTAEANVNLKNPFDNNSNILLAIPSKSITGNLSAFDGTIDFGGTSGRADTNITATDFKTGFITSTTLLPNFIGTNNYSLPVSTLGKSGCTGGGNLICKNQTFASGTVALSYEYEAFLMPVTNPSSFTNTTVGGNVNLSSALSVNNPDNLVITRYVIKTVPNPALGVLYYKDTTGKSIPITPETSLTTDQAKTLYFQPNSGSEGQQFNFTYSAVTPDSTGKDLESPVASVGISLLPKPAVISPAIVSSSSSKANSFTSSTPTPVVPSSGMTVITIGNNPNSSSSSSTKSSTTNPNSNTNPDTNSTSSSFSSSNLSSNSSNNSISTDSVCVNTVTNNSTNNIPFGSNDITKCFPANKDLDHYTVTDIKVGTDTAGNGNGNFFLVKSNGDKIKLNDNQDIVLTDSQVAFIVSTQKSCKECTVSLNIKTIDQKGNIISTTPVVFTLGNNGDFGGIGGGFQIDENNITVRTGGFTQAIKENWTLLLVLLLSVVFFFSSMSKTQIQRIFKKNP